MKRIFACFSSVKTVWTLNPGIWGTSPQLRMSDDDDDVDVNVQAHHVVMRDAGALNLRR
ncbi:hypothetical protein MD484_g4445, partial [Candolleomyces efflorescens]